MASAAQGVISTSNCAFPSNRFLRNTRRAKTRIFFSASASSPSNEESDCNDEECAPEKEVGKVSMDWLAGEKTKVVGTYPPRRRGWTGYVEKDTAGQTNIYSVEPAVYVAESAISSGSAGSSSDGSSQTASVVAGVAFVSIAAAAFILLLVGKNAPAPQTVDYAGPPLSYYISKFKPTAIAEAPVPVEIQDERLSVQSEIEQSGSTRPSETPLPETSNLVNEDV